MRKEFNEMSLAELAHSRAALQDYILQAVIQARSEGITWAGIGRQLGVSESEAHRRYSWTEKIRRHNPERDAG